jgi:hypothetical protein
MTAPVAHPDARDTRRYFGKYAGVVLNNDPPQQGDHLGQVLVEVSGILEDDPSGTGRRPLQTLAKPCFPPGFFFVPEPKANVWVEFAGGVRSESIWSGVWYAKGATPKTPDGQAPTRDQKIIRTRKEHVVLIDDTDNAEQVVVYEGKNKNKITIDQNGIIVLDKNKNQITLSSSGIVLDGLGKGRKITIDSSSVKLE